MRASPDLPHRIVEAAVAVACHQGLVGLRPSAVARSAGVPVGEVLRVFPRRGDLIGGIVGGIIEGFERALAHHIQHDPEPRGAFVRAYVELVLADRGGQTGVLVAEIARARPDLIAPIIESYRGCHGRLMCDGLDPATALMIRLAVDGLWTSGVFGMPDLPPAHLAAVVERIRALASPPAPAPAAPE